MLRTLIVGAVLVGFLALETAPAAIARTPAATSVSTTAPEPLTPGLLEQPVSPHASSDEWGDEPAAVPRTDETHHGSDAPKAADEDATSSGIDERAAHPAFVTQPETQHLFANQPLRISFSYNGTAILSEFVRLQRWVSGPGADAAWENVAVLQVQRGVNVQTFDLGAAVLSHSGRYRLHSHQANSQQIPIGYSDEFTISVNSPARVTRQPTDATTTVGETATFAVAYDAGTVPSSVQWERSARGSSTWERVPGMTSTTLAVPRTSLAMDGDRFRATIRSTTTGGVANGVTHTVLSTVVTLTVVPPVVEPPPVPPVPEFLEHPQDVAADEGQMVRFRARLSIPSGLGPDDVLVHWQTRPPGSQTWFTNTPWTAVVTDGSTDGGWANHSIFNVHPATHDGTTVRARVRLASGLDPMWVSDEATLTVRAGPRVTEHPDHATVLVGQPVSFAASASGSQDGWSQQWFTSQDGLSWLPIPGATQSTYTIPATTGAMDQTQYRARFRNDTQREAETWAAVLTVIEPPQASLRATPRTQAVDALP